MTDTKLSKYLSYILRHKPESIGLTLDSEGWVDVLVLISAAQTDGKIFTVDDVARIVMTCDKKRYSTKRVGDTFHIRAAQGHSTDQVKMTMKTEVPPVVLYHGTAERFVESIRKRGLLSMTRQYVHLSADIETAATVGTRHGKLVILNVDTKAMLADGHKFYKADNGVWLTIDVPPKYLK